MPPTTVPSGVLVVNKPVGPTSHDIVAQARRLYRTKAVGHAGTLDPMASGVLLLLLEEATKLSSALTLERKSYRAKVRFGFATDSDDAHGVPTVEKPILPGWLLRSQLDSVLGSERERTVQIPPHVSAIKTDGVAAHRRHRRGEVVERVARDVRVHALEVLDWSDEYLELSLEVSKGYYVRALARDLGEALAMPAHLSGLCRTSSGCFRLEEATNWPSSDLSGLISLTDVARRIMPTLSLNADGVRRARQGQTLLSEHFDAGTNPQPPQGIAAWLDEAGELVALGETDAEGVARVARGFRAGPG